MNELEVPAHVGVDNRILPLTDSFIRLIRYSTRGEVFPRFLVCEREGDEFNNPDTMTSISSNTTPESSSTPD
jgi:hypothetical protein